MKKIIFLLFLTTTIFGQSFLHTDGKNIVDENGTPFYFKGIGLGGWLVPEGYMLHMSPFANSPTEIKNKIIDLVGEDNAATFFDNYRAKFISKEDIDSLASMGFNSVRLPMHYELMTPRNQPFVYIEKGFAYIDSLLSWCRPHNIFVILDLHCAPGGQSDEPISDYNPNEPSLWESETNKLRTIDLWRKIALRYKEEPLIGGYDLLNEPKWDLPPNNQPLRDLYIQITDAIRESDSNHIVFIEGNWFATDFNGLTPPWDFNMAYSFHKYWSEVSASSIQNYLSIRNSYNVPLWMSESGENSNAWFTEFISLLNEKTIGWHWWTWKKLQSISVFASSPISPQFQTLLDYWNGTAPRPTVDFANVALQLQTNNLLLENCNIKKGVANAIFRNPYDNNTIPFAENIIPGRLYFTDYDYGNHNVAYHDNDYENIGNGSYNNGYSYRNDGVDIEPCSDQITNGYDVGWIDSGDWLLFTVNVSNSGIYEADFRISANQAGGKIALYLDDSQFGELIDVPVTGGWQNWQTLRVNNFSLTAGEHKLVFRFYFGGFNINFVDFVPTTGVEENSISTTKFSLEQNYPNPFSKGSGGNPTTTIKYSIPSVIARGGEAATWQSPEKTSVIARSEATWQSPELQANANNNDRFLRPSADGLRNDAVNVTLTVYDALGRKVATLVNKRQAPGDYSVKFTGNGLPSGIYFYTLRSGNFSTTKKMILMK